MKQGEERRNGGLKSEWRLNSRLSFLAPKFDHYENLEIEKGRDDEGLKGSLGSHRRREEVKKWRKKSVGRCSQGRSAGGSERSREGSE